ncbi:nitroreductase [soil metagenome]
MSGTTGSGDREHAFEELVRGRHSCRSFLPTTVAHDDIERMLELAQTAPSWCNTQPWSVTMVSGDALTRLSAALLASSVDDTGAADVEPPREYVGVRQERRRASGYALYESLGIERDDRARRIEQANENYRFFGAPHCAIISGDLSLGTYAALDCGAYVGTLLLAARSLGIATIAQAAIAMHSNVVRAELGLRSDESILCGVSFGFEDTAAPANSFRAPRAPLAESVTWRGAGG